MTAKDFLELYYCEESETFDNAEEGPLICLIIHCRKKSDNMSIYSDGKAFPTIKIISDHFVDFKTSSEDKLEIDRLKRVFLATCLEKAGVTDFNPTKKSLPDITPFFTKPEPENPEN
ncbi:hypothetical protein [Aquirufa aurantiipilula]